ncbi:DUF2235 domain-containing protein (plasmid) [Sinorhizobium meliloti]|uniref:phospholipase effector Tle1 domain-containing protein n=1 Tax=Rhizobium meliloti TaxID=382 RepID=UPI001F2D3F3B|nr:DUF2235 domain-containing protein [Sinorhizobium meliloti]WQO97371.1 DUF2235 domain-containing protein [Sinorhizobium meliloti]
MQKNIVLLADGTGNSASKLFKTNVWRLYEALDLNNQDQIASFSDGVGTSSFKPFEIIGLALGFGVKRRVIGFYKFLSLNYQPADRIYAFGFSRGAFIIRVLVGLVAREGLVDFQSHEELDRKHYAKPDAAISISTTRRLGYPGFTTSFIETTAVLLR